MKEKRLRELEKPSKYKDFLRAIARIQIRHPFLTLALILGITILLFGGISKVRTVASLEKMMPTDVDEIKAFNTLRDNGLGQDIIAIVIELDPDISSTTGVSLDIKNYEYYIYVKNLKSMVSSEDNVVSAYAFSDIVDAVAIQMGYIDKKELKNLYALSKPEYQMIINAPMVQEQVSQFINDDRTNTIIMLTTDISADDTRMNLLSDKVRQDIDAVGKPANSKISITGTPIIQQKLGSVIEHDRKVTERISALFVFILVAIVFGSVVAAIVPMVTIILSIIWLYGLMGYLDLPISTLAGGVAAMVIGIGVDYSIHLRNKFEYERKKGESLEYAVEETMGNTGYVLTTVTFVTGIAFLSFLYGEMPEMGRFGLLMTLGVSLAFLLSVVGLPALFIVEEKIIDLVKKRVHFGVESELVLVDKDAATCSTNKKNHSVRVK